MKAVLRSARAIEAGLGRGEEWLGIVLVAGLLLVVNLQILARYVFHAPFIWPEEVSRLLLVWMTFIGAAAVTRRVGDLAVDTFIVMLPPGARRAMLVIRDLLMAVVFAVVAFEGFSLARAVSGMPLVATGLPTALLAWPVIVGCGLTVFHCLVRLLALLADPAVDETQAAQVLT